jgi:hypothetical protein
LTAAGLERRGANWIGFPDFHVAGLFVYDHFDADVCDQPRGVVATAAAHVDPVLVEARERDKSHIDVLNLAAGVPLKTAAEIRQDRLLDHGVISESGAACQGGEHGGGEEVRPYADFGLDAHHDQVASPKMIAEYKAIVAASRRSPD